MNTNIWRLDTCGCEIEYAFDPSTSEDDQVHTHRRSLTVEPAEAA